MTSTHAIAGLSLLTIRFGPPETMDRLIASVGNRGLTVFARIDHGAGAAAAGLPLRATELLIFGNARGGTPFTQVAQTAGIDLPLKALVWQDEDGAVWIGWNDPAWIAARHDFAPDSKAIENLREALAKIANEAAGIAI